jgi:ribosomal protein S18 acetylase RimI-like enzyme
MLNFRKATEKDLDFIVEAIIASEKSGTEILSWARILDISEAETAQLVRDILLEEIDGQEWAISNFVIAEKKGVPASALSAWIEGETGMASGIVKAQTIAFLMAKKWKAAESRLRQVSAIQIPRTSGALQLENIYTHPDFRGQGIVRQLIAFVLKTKLMENPQMQFAEIQLMGENKTALHSYTQCGFLKQAESIVSDASILNLLPGTYRVSLQLELHHGNHRDPGKT